MADRYWVGGTASWDGTAGTKWSTTSGGGGGASVPTSVDDVFFTNLSTGLCTIAAGNTGAKSINCTGFTGTITGSTGITVSGSVTLAAGMGFTTSATWTIAGTGTVTSAGKTFNALTINGAGITVSLGDNLSITNSLTVTQGTFDTTASNYSIAASSLVSSNSNTRTINLNGSTLNLSSASTALNFGTSTNLTFNAGTSQINVTGVGALFAGGGQTFNNVSFTSTAVNQNSISGVNTFTNLTITASTANPGIKPTIISDNQTITGTLTCAGATVLRRVYLLSNLIGTPRTLTVATLSAQDCDFRDITIAGAAAGSSPTRAGDCGGNSGITFPAAKTVYWNLAGTQSWTNTAWATTPTGTPALNNFPLAQDTAVFTNSGSAGTVDVGTNDMNIGAVDASGRTSAITLNYGSTPTYYGSHTLGSGVTVTGTTGQFFSGRGTTTFTSAGKTITFAIVVDCGPATFQLADTYISSNIFRVTSGTFNTVNNNLTCTLFESNNLNVRTITLGTSTINVSGTGPVWNFATTTNLTFSGASSTINLTDTTTTARTVNGGGLTYGTLNIGGATGTSTTTINLGTFATLSSTKTVAHTITISQPCTINNWTVTGTAGNVVTVNSSTVGTLRSITYGGSQINLDYMSFTDIFFNYTLGASNPYLVYAGANSTNGGNNIGIAFIDGTTKKAYRLTTGTTWTVPADFTSTNNIYLIGAGGGGATAAVSGNNRAAGGGGGGGGYTAITNFSASPSSSISYTVGTSAGNTNGLATTWNSGAFTAGGGSRGNATTAPTSSGGAGGTGTFAGGTGGVGAFGTTASQGYGAGAGGGAGGPNGIGGNGGNGFGSLVTANIAGGGGGGNGGGSNGANATSAQGGNGGNNFAGTGGGAGSASGSGTAGTIGGGGGGAANTGSGGSGGAGIDLQNTLGGGGGGGGSATGAGTPVSGLYGGGGAGGRVTTAGSFTAGTAGGQGVIFIVYNYGAAPSQNSNFFLMFG